METLFELVESLVFRVDPKGVPTPLSRSAVTLAEGRQGSSLLDTFGVGTHAEMVMAASAGESKTVSLRRGAGDTKIKWEFVAPTGIEGEVIAVGIDWLPASELVERMTKESLIFKETVMNIVPRFIVEAMLERKVVQPKAYREATIMFVDALGFSDLAANMDPVRLLKKLDYYFSSFDRTSVQYGLEKLKTVGDAYMAVSGIPYRKPSHAVDAVLAALAIMRGVTAGRAVDSGSDTVWDFRVGLHSGPCISGVLGDGKYTFDIWGDAVNIASRLEAVGEPGKVTISGATATLVEGFFDVTARGTMPFGVREVPIFEVTHLKRDLAADAMGTVPNGAFRAKYRAQFLRQSSLPSMAPPAPFLDEDPGSSR